jgi:hypothetical protein
MINQQKTGKPVLKFYRGALVYRQEDGYTLITITVSLHEQETSQVISHANNLPVLEEPEHLPGVDLYHFAVVDDTRIQLTITSPMGVAEVWYTVSRHTALVSPLHLRLIHSSESIICTPAIPSSNVQDKLIGRILTRGGK